MSRYIDAEHLKETLKELEAQGGHKYYRKGIQDAIDGYFPQIIDDEPTADVEPVRHGRWIDKGVLENYPKPDVNVYHLLWCSECGALHRARPWCGGGWINANYCPNCGAKMDRGESDE